MESPWRSLAGQHPTRKVVALKDTEFLRLLNSDVSIGRYFDYQVHGRMPALSLVSAVVLAALETLKLFSSSISSSFRPFTMDCGNTHIVVTDLTVSFCPPADAMAACALDSQKWHRIEKELYLHTAQQSAWLHVAQSEEKEMTADDLVVEDIRIGELCPNSGSDESWESRAGGIWGTYLLLFSSSPASV